LRLLQGHNVTRDEISIRTNAVLVLQRAHYTRETAMMR
jgi:hypothetical protein